MQEKNCNNYCKICENARNAKMINSKNARNNAKQEIWFIAINHNVISCENFSLFLLLSHLSWFFAFITLCEKYSRCVKNARNVNARNEKCKKCKKCNKFCDMINHIYCN